MNTRFNHLVDGLADRGCGIADAIFPAEIIQGLRRNLADYYERDQMHPAGVGKKFDYQRNAEVRGDVIRWLEKDSKDPSERYFLDTVTAFGQHVNATCFTSINDLEFHYAYYQEGSFFKRHIDQFRSDRGRVLSFVLYLNENWKESEGGKLSLYLPEGELSLYPEEGRVVTFRSDQVEHEVHPSIGRGRMSIAGWLKKS